MNFNLNFILRFNLINMRADYMFVLYTGGLKKPLALARSNAVTFANMVLSLRFFDLNSNFVSHYLE